MATVVNPASSSGAMAADPGRIVPVYVWQMPVRLAHWGLVIALVVLTITGSYMHDPYLVAHGERAWFMGWMRFIHELSGFFLIGIFVPRAYWFFAGNRWAQWRAWLPLTARQRTSFKSMVAYYGFRRRKPLEEIGHNSLAALAYICVFGLVAVEFLTGLVLFSVVEGGPVLRFLVGWIPRLIDIQWIRSVHFLGMFIFVGFFIHHVYSAVLVGIAEKNGEIESIFTGWKFVPRHLLQEDEAREARAAEGRSKRHGAKGSHE
jgi:Ni/Fe-hydrogenase 1 B-type cytochrome subunit